MTVKSNFTFNKCFELLYDGYKFDFCISVEIKAVIFCLDIIIYDMTPCKESANYDVGRNVHNLLMDNAIV